MIDIDTKDRAEQRKFGLVMGAAFLVITLIRWAHHRWSHGEWGEPSYLLLDVGAVFAGLGVLAPRALQEVFWLWIKFALAMNWFMTRLFLSIVFFLLITPVRYVRMFMGIDALKRKWDPGAATYWEEPEEQPEDPRRYLNQY